MWSKFLVQWVYESKHRNKFKGKEKLSTCLCIFVTHIKDFEEKYIFPKTILHFTSKLKVLFKIKKTVKS